ncbi:Gfo/Idh/MocA family oxidoreductase, partial [Paracoccus sp. PXZ]
MTQTVPAQSRRAPRIRLGMVGGGQGAFIGAVHRIAARIDDQYELVAGCFSSTPEKSAASAAELGVGRAYGDFAQMAMREARRKDGIEAVAVVTPNHLHAPIAMAMREARRKDGIEAVAVVTPNHLHAPIARAFLKRGIHVICDKPLTASLPEARKLAKAAEGSEALFVLTHNYTGYPMVRQARAMTLAGELGEIRLVQVEYAQDWLAEPIEQAGNKQAGWRTDPAQSGAGGAIGDIGTHAFNLAGFVTGLELEALAADLHSFVPGRAVDDNGHVLLRYRGGARGMLWCSQVASGCENALRLRVYGSRAGIEWAQEEPNYLWVTQLGRPRYRLSRGGTGTGAEAARLTRI